MLVSPCPPAYTECYILYCVEHTRSQISETFNPLTAGGIILYTVCIGETDFLKRMVKFNFCLYYETFLQEFTSLDMSYHDIRTILCETLNPIVSKSAHRLP